jgi:hypothetical protein
MGGIFSSGALAPSGLLESITTNSLFFITATVSGTEALAVDPFVMPFF